MNFFKGVVTLIVLVTLVSATEYVCRAQGQAYDQLSKAASWGSSSHGWQLGIVGPRAAFRVGEPIDITALVRNNGPRMGIEPLEPYAFDTALANSDGNEVTGTAESLNTTGMNEIFVDTNTVVKNVLLVSYRYPSLSSGTYRLTASTNIIQGSSMGGTQDKPVFITHLTSSTVTITVLP